MSMLVKNEFFKLLKSKRYYVFICIVIALIILLAIATKSILNSESVNEEIINRIRPYDFPMQVLGSMTDFLLPVFLTLIITFFISDEFVATTFKLPLLHGFKRVEVLLAKVITTIIVVFLLLVITFLVSYGISFMIWGSEVYNTAVILETIKGYILTLVPLISFMFIIVTIALLSKNSGVVIGIMVSLLVGGFLIGSLIPKVNKYSIVYYLKAFAVSSENLDLVFSSIVCILYCVVFFVVSNQIVRRLEINK